MSGIFGAKQSTPRVMGPEPGNEKVPPQHLGERLCCAIVAGFLLAAAGGCDDVSLEFDQPPQRPVRAAPVPIGPAARPAPATTALTPTSRPAPAPGSSAAAPVPAPAAADPRPGARESVLPVLACYQQVVLLNEPPPEDSPSGVRYVQVKHASAQDVGCLLSWLYVPAGPTGTRNRYCLVYPSAREADAAALQASQLDTAPVVSIDPSAVPADGAEALALGLGIFFSGPGERQAGAKRTHAAVSVLTRALADPGLPATQRWMAGMIAGRAAGECLNDFEAAQRHFTAAESQAQPGSIEQLNTWLAQACAHIQNGQPRLARQVLNRIRSQSGILRETEPYDRAGRALRDLDRNR